MSVSPSGTVTTVSAERSEITGLTTCRFDDVAVTRNSETRESFAEMRARTASRPETPSAAASPNPNAPPVQHATSVSLPVGTEANAVREKELENMLAELERRRAECEKERRAREETLRQKEALEAELESLSQALFEEVSAMFSNAWRSLIHDATRQTKWLRPNA